MKPEDLEFLPDSPFSNDKLEAIYPTKEGKFLVVYTDPEGMAGVMMVNERGFSYAGTQYVRVRATVKL